MGYRNLGDLLSVVVRFDDTGEEMTEALVKEKPVEVAKKAAAPAASLTVPVVPTLVTVGNIAVTSSALAVSSGVAGPIVAVVAAATGLAMIRHHKSKRPGAKTFGTKRSAIRSSRSGGGRPSAAGRLGKGLAGRAAGRLGSKLGRLGKGLTGTGGSLSNSRIGRAARRAGKALSPVGRAMRGASRGVDRAFRGAGAGLSKAGRAAGKVGRFARRVVRPGELERARRKRDIDAQRDRKYNRKNVGPKVNEPPKFTKDPQKPQKPSVKPAKDIPVAKGNGPTGNKGPSLNGSQLAELTKVFTAQVQNVRHKGHVETFAEAKDLPLVISMFAEALHSRVAEYSRSSVHPDYVQALSTLCSAMDSLSVMSRDLAAVFADVHSQLLMNLFNSPDPATWDTSNNGV
jgi:hypothetical protein